MINDYMSRYLDMTWYIDTVLAVCVNVSFCVCWQVDLGYRKTWDKLVIKLEVVDQDDKTSCEVVQWVMHFPVSSQSHTWQKWPLLCCTLMTLWSAVAQYTDSITRLVVGPDCLPPGGYGNSCLSEGVLSAFVCWRHHHRLTSAYFFWLLPVFVKPT